MNKESVLKAAIKRLRIKTRQLSNENRELRKKVSDLEMGKKSTQGISFCTHENVFRDEYGKYCDDCGRTF